MRALAVAALAVAMLAGCTTDPEPASLDSTTVSPEPVETSAPQPTPGSTEAPARVEEENEKEVSRNGTPEEEPEVAPLQVDVGGPYSGQNLAWIDLGANVTGGLGTASCTWSGEGAFTNASSCSTQVSFGSVGTHVVLLGVTDGDQSLSVEVPVEVAFPVSDGLVTGNIFAYNQPGGVGASNLVANAVGTYYYLQGTDISVSGRSVSGPGVDAATPGEFYMLDAEGTVVRGPFDVTGSAETLSSGVAFAAGTHTLDVPAGTYYLSIRLLLEDGFHWIKDGSGGHETGHKEIEVLGSPA